MSTFAEAPALHKAFQAHRTRQLGLALCKQLIDLTLEFQKHRGCTLAILSGDHFFETQLFSIQRDITELLQRFEVERREFLTLAEAKHILQEWVCIRRLWRKDSIQQNFLLHSNLIGELLKSVWVVAQRTEQGSDNARPDELTTLCLRDWPQIIEVAAQARGLATHVAVSQNQDPQIQSRIRFLGAQLTELNAVLLARMKSINHDFACTIEATMVRTEYARHLDEFQHSLEFEILGNRRKSARAVDADHIYTLGSHVVSAAHQIMLAGLKRLEKTMSPELTAWVQGQESVRKSQ